MLLVPPKLYFFDKVFKYTILRLIPCRVMPNHLTVVRFLMTPFIVFLLWQGSHWWGLILFLIAASTDALDGAMARTRNQITEWGKVYDPLADKLLICSVIFVLLLKYVDFYAAWIIIIIEFFIVLTALIKKQKGKEIKSNFWGKMKMILQVAGVVFMLLAIVFNFDALVPISRNVLYLSIGFAIISLFTYSA
jgi:CDP-diacylglycerol--glycerol-3-phosphate 3-phosphatidyltransferase